MTDPITASVPRHLHEVTFTSEGFLAVRAFCKGCGWQRKATGFDSDKLYWMARAHINEAPESVGEGE